MLLKAMGFGVLSLSVMLVLAACAGGGGPTAEEGSAPHKTMAHQGSGGHDHGAAREEGSMEGDPAPLVCPVSGMSIPEGKGIVYDHQGQKITFCCEDCVSIFEKDPGKYLK